MSRPRELERRRVRCITLSDAVSDRLDLYISSPVVIDLLQAKLSPDDVKPDKYGLLPANYEHLREALPSVEKTTHALIMLAFHRPELRAYMDRACRENRKLFRDNPTINASRVIEALIIKSLDILEATSAITPAPAKTKPVKQPPITDWERKAPMHVKDPIRKAFIEANLAKTEKPSKKTV
jgi:hypothetical protein